MHITHRLALTAAALGAFGMLTHPAMAQGSLAGTYYHPANGSISSITEAQNYMNSHGASGYFTSTASTLAAGYSGGDTSLITSFLGTDGVSFTGTAGDLSDGILSLSGAVTVVTPGTFTFSTSSDDGSALFIDGTEVINNDGNHLNQLVSNTATLSAGQHSVNVVYFNHGLQTANGLTNFAASLGGLTASPVPEPSSVAAFALTGLGVLGSALKARKRRTAA